MESGNLTASQWRALAYIGGNRAAGLASVATGEDLEDLRLLKLITLSVPRSSPAPGIINLSSATITLAGTAKLATIPTWIKL